MLQIILTLAIFVILVIPMGKYMYHIATKQKTFADKVFNPIDRCIYKVCGIKGEDMGWKKYALTLLLVNAVMVFVGYAILRLQSILFLNPNGISNMEPTLSFNTIISFMTNTNLQHYSEEDFPIALWHGSGIQTKILSFALEKKCICSRFIK